MKIGDRVELKDPTDHVSYSGVSGGQIVKMGPVNVTVETTVRFRPEGPWYTSRHKVPRTHVTKVIPCL